MGTGGGMPLLRLFMGKFDLLIEHVCVIDRFASKDFIREMIDHWSQ